MNTPIRPLPRTESEVVDFAIDLHFQEQKRFILDRIGKLPPEQAQVRAFMLGLAGDPPMINGMETWTTEDLDNLLTAFIEYKRLIDIFDKARITR